MIRIPDEVRETVYERVSENADRLNWLALPAPDKSRLYTQWAQDSEIGAVLLGFMSMSQVHRYLKDTVVKTYAQRKISDPKTALNLLGVGNVPTIKTWEKPPGVTLSDRRIVAWHKAETWKTTLLAVYERAYVDHGMPFAAVLFEAEGKFADEAFRSMVLDAATRLGVEQLVWNPL